MRTSTPGRTGKASAASLVHAIHAAALNVADWPTVLERLRTRLGAQVLTLGRHEFVSGSETATLQSPAGSAFSSDLAQFAARNPWFLSSDAYQAGRVMTGDELISHAELRRTDFYRQFLQPRGLLHLLCGVVEQRTRSAHVLAAYRAETQAPFSAEHKADLAELLGHIQLSVQNQWRWQEAHDLAQALLGLANHDANPTMLVGADAEPVHSNPAALALLQRQHGLRMDGSRIVAAHAAERRLLGATIARLADDDALQAGSAAPAVLTLATGAGLPPLVVVVRAAGQVFRAQFGGRRGLAMLTVRGSPAEHDPASCLFAQRFELTAAQSRVSSLVFAGQPLALMAQTLNLSENTVRSHLKQIFQKTDTHGQMELVHLHARFCPNLP